MSTSEDAAMTESGDKASRFRPVSHSKTNKKAKDSIATEGETNHIFIYPMRILMTADDPGTKRAYKATYNPIPKTKTLLMTMADIDPGLTITSLDGKTKLTITKDTFPKTEETFKKYFTCDWEKASGKQKERVRLGCTINGNCTLNTLKHGDKPSKLLQWLSKEQVFIEADTLGMGKTKTIGYLTGIHPRIINRASAKEKLYDTLNATFISHSAAQKLDSSITENTTMQDEDDEPTVHCPGFEIFQTTIGIGSGPRLETDVIGIKCQSGRAALLREFLLKSGDNIEKTGHGKFIPAGLANVIGIKPMKTIIRQNNQFLKTITSIPINGLSKVALQTEIIIDEEAAEEDQVKMTVNDYILSAEWCHGFEPTNREGRYLLITTHQQISKACQWLDENLEELFTECIPQYQKFTPIEGYDYPKRGDKPRFSHQLGTYADQLRALYTNSPSSNTTDDKQWNKSPLNKPRHPNTRTLTFDTDEYPELPKQKHAKRNQNGNPKQPEVTPTNQPAPSNTETAKALRDQIIADIREDLKKTLTKEVTELRNEITGNITELSKNLKEDFNAQIAEVIATIQALNQRFTEVMECLPTTPQTMPAHKKSKGLGIAN